MGESKRLHDGTCCQSGFGIEVRYCEVDEVWRTVVMGHPQQLTLFDGGDDAVCAVSDGIWTSVKAAVRMWLQRDASYRAAEARSRLRRL